MLSDFTSSTKSPGKKTLPSKTPSLPSVSQNEEKEEKVMKESLRPQLFSNDIDNTCGVKSYENYMIGPLYDQHGRSIGVLQMFNFKGVISKYQIERFKAL